MYHPFFYYSTNFSNPCHCVVSVTGCKCSQLYLLFFYFLYLFTISTCDIKYPRWIIDLIKLSGPPTRSPFTLSQNTHSPHTLVYSNGPQPKTLIIKIPIDSRSLVILWNWCGQKVHLTLLCLCLCFCGIVFYFCLP